MKHLLNNLSEEEKNSIREQHEGGMKVNTDRFKALMESELGNVKPLINEEMTVDSKHTRNNPEWIKLVGKLKNLSYPPKVLTFNTYDTPPVPSQSLNWGLAKTKNGNYGFTTSSTTPQLPKERMNLFTQGDKNTQTQMHKWWKDKGYQTDGFDIDISFRDADRLARDIQEFFKVYPPEK
jgi:hypothetical protein